ncbi:MAG: CDP-diacylglycerol diphosphatase [Burkholderiales bacterium]|jgi:CDP-diacylglycerol pyrophosphatase|nr:CDP-diacylglycerol diphosphatase [Burkholderiales bacterium]
MKYKRRIIFSAVAGLLLAGIFIGIQQWQHSRGTLWRILSTNCIPAAQVGKPGKCAEVALSRGTEAGDVVFKDRNGVLQYLLMPTRRVSGIEDAFLYKPDAPPYWADAWRARRWMDVSNLAPVPRDDVAITVNSAWGRSQDQLHFHISCIRADLRSYLRSSDARIGETWSPLKDGWRGHPYEVRRLVAENLDGQNLFLELAKDSSSDFGRQAIAVIGTRINGRDGFWLLRTHVDFGALWLASIEGDVQDHTCSVLHGTSGEDAAPRPLAAR